MTGPLVTVVMAVYNAEAFLAEALDSVYAQDYEPFEVVLVDDGSTDGSAAIAQSYPGLRYLRQENGGPSAARNAAIAAARGELVAVADADDVQLPGRLSVQVGYLVEHPEVAVTLGRQIWSTPTVSGAISTSSRSCRWWRGSRPCSRSAATTRRSAPPRISICSSACVSPAIGWSCFPTSSCSAATTAGTPWPDRASIRCRRA